MIGVDELSMKAEKKYEKIPDIQIRYLGKLLLQRNELLCYVH